MTDASSRGAVQPISVVATRAHGPSRLRWIAPALLAALVGGGAVVYVAMKRDDPPKPPSVVPAAAPTPDAAELSVTVMPDAAVSIDAAAVASTPEDAAPAGEPPRKASKGSKSRPPKPPKPPPSGSGSVAPPPAGSAAEPTLDFLKSGSGAPKK
jgi:hypothetical protein